MKKNTYFIPIVLFFLTSLTFSCKKDDSGGRQEVNSGFTMKINGEPWGAYLTTLLTEEHDDSTYGKYYYGMISGTWARGDDDDDAAAEAMGLYALIPADKFRNPKGIYTIRQQELGKAWALFSTSTDIRDATTYASVDPGNSGRDLGTLEITNFEIGTQSVLGQSTGTEGYTRLSGKFQVELFPVEDHAGKLNITEGKFDLTSGMGFNF